MTRDESIEILKTDGCYECYVEADNPFVCNNCGCEIREAYYMAIEALERKKGRWTKKAEYLDTPTVCTLCGHEYVEYVEGWEWEDTGDLPNYCPNCGADMRERREDE